MAKTNTAQRYEIFHDFPASDRTTDDGLSLDAFVAEAIQATKLELELGKVAMRHSASGEVKQFAQRLLLDFSGLESDLLDIAARNKRSGRHDLDGGHQGELFRLAALRGPEFDAAYVNRIIDNHDLLVAIFKSASPIIDPSLSAVARTALIRLQGHRRLIEDLVPVIQANAVAYLAARSRGPL